MAMKIPIFIANMLVCVAKIIAPINANPTAANNDMEHKHRLKTGCSNTCIDSLLPSVCWFPKNIPPFLINIFHNVVECSIRGVAIDMSVIKQCYNKCLVMYNITFHRLKIIHLCKNFVPIKGYDDGPVAHKKSKTFMNERFALFIVEKNLFF